MIAAFLTICGVLVLFGVLAAITAVWERLPMYPPADIDDEVLPEPEIRARVRRVDPEREWIIEEKA